MPRNVQHNTSANSHGRELNEHVLQLLSLVRTSLKKLRDDGNGSNVEECTSSEGKKHIAPGLQQVSNLSRDGSVHITYQASSPDTLVTAHGDVTARATELLNSNTNESTKESTQGSDKLRAHSSSLGKAGLDEKSEIANLVRDLVEEDCYSSGSPNGRRGIETGRHSQAIGDVVCKVGTVSVSTVSKDQSREINIH